MKPSVKETNNLRLQVFLSRSGACSRRKAMELIQQGCVSVNGKIVTEPSTAVVPGKDRVCLNDKPVQEHKTVFVMLNKPAGYVTTVQDSFAEKTVMELLPKELQHLKPAGRLDKDTEGLLIFTNDGDMAYKLTHPKFNVDKTYVVRINGRLKPEQRNRLERGIEIEGGKTAPAKVAKVTIQGPQTEFLITIHEGRKRQVRMMVQAAGHRVLYLQRIAQGPLKLGDLPKGQWRILETNEINLLTE